MPLSFVIRPLAIGTLLLAVAAGCGKKKKTEIEETRVEFSKEGRLLLRLAADSSAHVFDIEIADNPYEIQTGLMYREKMEDTQGMLFIFEDERFRSFYMKNTEISLDILFIGADSTVNTIHRNARPLDESSLPSEQPSQYVFEINGGLSERLGVEIGDRIEFERLQARPPENP